MTLQEILAAVNDLSAEDKGTLFSGLGKDMEKLPVDLEQKFLNRKNAKLTAKDEEIATLTTQVTDLTEKLKPYQATEDEKKKTQLKTDIGDFFTKVENYNPSMKGTFTREIMRLKAKEENKDKDVATLAGDYIKTHNGFTVQSKIVELDDEEKNKNEVPGSVADMIAQAKKQK